jgi:diguanylate cyclase
MFSTFRFRVALAFGLLALALVVTLSLILGSSASRAVTRDQSEALATLARSTSIALAEGLFERMREVELLAASPPAGDPATDGALTWKSLLQRMQTTRPQYSWIGFADPSGKVVVATGDLLLGQSVVQRPWFLQGLKGAYTGDVHQALLLAKLLPPTTSGEPPRFVDFSAPVNNPRGRPLGVLGVHATWDWARSVVESLQSQSQRDKQVTVFILDREGTVIHPPGAAAPAHKLVQMEGLPAEGAADLRWSDGRNYLTAASRVSARSSITDLGWTVVVRQPLNEALATARAASKAALIVGGAAALAAVVLAWLLAGALARPLSRIAEAAKRVESGDLQAEIPALVEAQELSELSGALRGMKESLVRREEALARANTELEQRVAQRTLELERANIELETLARKDAHTGQFKRSAAD